MKAYSTINLLFQLLLFLIINELSAQETFTRDFSEINDRVEQLLKSYVDFEEAVGMSLTVVHKDKIIYSQGFGKADLELGVPVTDSTLFRLASVSKLFTAAAIAKLSETGALDLDAPVEQYLPAFSGKRWKPTIRQVAAHIGGIRGYMAKDFEDGKDIFKDEFPTTDSSLKIFVADSLLFEPGTGYKYSTFGFTILTAVIEEVSGKKFEKYMEEEIVVPLLLGQVVPDRPERVITHRSGFYDVEKDRKVVNAPFIRSDFKFGGGGLLASSKTLAKFGAAHIQTGFFKVSTLEHDLFKEQSKRNGKSVNVGLAWRVGIDKNFGRVYHHSGSLPGGRSVLMVWPDQELVLASTSNTTNSPYYAEQFAQVLSHIYLDEISISNHTPNTFESLTKKLIFSSTGDREYLLELHDSGNNGSLEVPVPIKNELKRRKFPVPNVLPVLKVYSNENGSSSIVISSDIGLHRLEIEDILSSNASSGFIEELSNKFEWEIKRHRFKTTE